MKYSLKICSALMLSSSLLALSSAPLWAAQTSHERPDLRLTLEQISLDAETGKMDQAFALLDKLKAAYPDNPQVLQAEANLNLRLGNRGAGFAALNKALTLDPGNEDIMDQQRSAGLGQTSFAGGGYTFRQSKQANEQLANLSGRASLSPTLIANILVENDRLGTRQPLTNTNGAMERFNGDRQRATATLEKLYNSGDEAAASLYAGNDSVGAGAQYKLWDRYGTTRIEANLQKPDWDYVEMVVGNGTKDNISLERKQIFSSNLQATLSGGYNQYNLQQDWDVADAVAWDLNVGYSHPYAIMSGNNITLGAFYTVDAEYFTAIERKTVGGVTYKPFPANSYEIHALNASVSKEFWSQWFAEGFGGYAINRLGGRGPSYGGSLEYAPQSRLGVELRASRTIIGERNSGEVNQIGLNLKWRW